MADEAPAWLWTASQRRALILVGLLCVAFLAIRRYTHPLPLPDQASAGVEDESTDTSDTTTKPVPVDKIDPDTASAAMLATLPLIGEKRAQTIIDYREAQKKLHPGSRVFRQANDLTRIRGIGKATVERLSPYLMFDEAATRGAE